MPGGSGNLWCRYISDIAINTDIGAVRSSRVYNAINALKSDSLDGQSQRGYYVIDVCFQMYVVMIDLSLHDLLYIRLVRVIRWCCEGTSKGG